MIIYNPKTKKAMSLYLEEFIKKLQLASDGIMFGKNYDNVEYPLYIATFKNSLRKDLYYVKMSQSEVDAFNSILPKKRKDDTYNVKRIGV